MNKLVCDICGGKLVMQSGGRSCQCDCCGIEYSTERLKEKVQEIRGVVSIEGTIKTQDADFIIRGGVLQKYNGNDTDVVIPDTVVEIGRDAFKNCPGIQSVDIPPTVTCIGESAFSGCRLLQKIYLPDSLEEIQGFAFYGCASLEKIALPQSIKKIKGGAFSDCAALRSINIPDSVEEIGYGTFKNCPSLHEIETSYWQESRLLSYGDWPKKNIFETCDGDENWTDENCGTWYLNFKCELADRREKQERERRRSNGKCQYCGGSFKGIFTQVCARCGKPKDY